MMDSKGNFIELHLLLSLVEKISYCVFFLPILPKYLGEVSMLKLFVLITRKAYTVDRFFHTFVVKYCFKELDVDICRFSDFKKASDKGLHFKINTRTP